MDPSIPSKDKPKYYLTTPIYYANSRPHVGSAYTTIVCDVIARYKRMCGYEVEYLTGTDEHGVNIERAAEKLGITPAELVDRNQQIFRDLWKLLGISYTDFVRTTSPQHAVAVQNLVRRTQRITPEAIFKRKYEGRYCIYDNLYVSDTPEPADCQICGRPAELISEENYFFRLSAYQDKLLQLYKDQPDFVQPDFRLHEVKSFVESGLKDLSISRKSIKWGIPWPGDSEHVFYVWYDALTSYISGIGFVDGEPGSKKDSEKFKTFWPADLHMIGKEIIRFHAVYWPAFLMAAELPLPKKIFAHGWLLFEQEKMSKSKGNVAYPEPIVRVLGNDALRYYLLRETVFGQDGNFSREALITRYNADLANGLGNLVSRVVAMANSYLQGEISFKLNLGVEGAQHWLSSLRSAAEQAIKQYKLSMEQFEFSRAVEAIWNLVSAANQFLVHTEPWKFSNEPSSREPVGQRLGFTVNCIRIVAVMAHPVMPDSTERIWRLLGLPGQVQDQSPGALDWQFSRDVKVATPEAVFPRADKKEALERIEAMEQGIRNPGSAQPAADAPATPATVASSAAATTAAAAAPAAAPASTKITIEDFAKVELRVGVVKSAERIVGADKLLKLMVDIGDEVRQVLAGIALGYTPEELMGRKVVVVINLAPRKMRGLESNGMLLAASAGADGKPVLCTFAEDIPVGSKVK
jgi:methionyl-tRNA synthetase